MDWKSMLSYISGSVDEELLLGASAIKCCYAVFEC